MIPIEYDINQGKHCLFTTIDLAAEVEIFDDGDWMITGYYIDKGHNCFEPVEDQDLINFLGIKEKDFQDQIEPHLPAFNENDEHRLGHVELLGRRA